MNIRMGTDKVTLFIKQLFVKKGGGADSTTDYAATKQRNCLTFSIFSLH